MGLTNVDYQQWDYEVKNVKMKWFWGVLVTKFFKKKLKYVCPKILKDA
jgi:hypothetical protein